MNNLLKYILLTMLAIYAIYYDYTTALDMVVSSGAPILIKYIGYIAVVGVSIGILNIYLDLMISKKQIINK